MRSQVRQVLSWAYLAPIAGGPDMTRQVFILAHPIARQRAIAAVQSAPDGFRLVLSEARKSREQEEKYHAMFGDIAKQMPMHGRLRDEETIKRLCVDQFYRDTKDDPDLREHWRGMGELEMLPSLDGSGVVALGWQTRRFPKPLASALVEWLYALGAEGGVVWSEPERKAA
jgi:hypothetical protein